MIWQVSEMHIPEIDDQGQQEYRSCLWTKPEQVGGDEDVGFSPGISTNFKQLQEKIYRTFIRKRPILAPPSCNIIQDS